MTVLIRRVYEHADPADGFRVYVDRLWPRGLSRERAAIDLWLKDIGPSAGLREWFDRADRFAEFSARYTAELDHDPAVGELVRIARANPVVTLLYRARSTERNHAAVLAAFLNRRA
ncbi:DUF488 domain-containing protein [Actinoallomurus bryophytorum]|uniref:Uncharacterized protein YeaO (DUF488 family) n=1 Tax=Actinoallomurus bryophytorum TaxID=1490222 RepID=A0A543CVC5_9ACTN|nr:DUF488 family protein [Actinoallomurus bryophytorum]TQM01050.1 uncharacterized protein YeaO (DUF488 family) [Actinoallomurus bryophytorum]